MKETDILILAVWAVGALGAWLLGYHYGARSLRNRNKKVIEAIEENNKIYKDWHSTPQGSDWERGYAEGIKITLDTLDNFLDKAT